MALLDTETVRRLGGVGRGLAWGVARCTIWYHKIFYIVWSGWRRREKRQKGEGGSEPLFYGAASRSQNYFQ